MYFVSPPGTAISVSQNPGDRQQLHQQQRFPTNYSFNAQTMTPPSQANCTNHKYNIIAIFSFLSSTTIDIVYILANYVGSYPVAYNSVPAVTTPSDYTYQPPVHMVPTYYPPGQPAMQPPPVMYHRVPTPPNTPTSNQVINDQYEFRAMQKTASICDCIRANKLFNYLLDTWYAADVRQLEQLRASSDDAQCNIQSGHTQRRVLCTN